VGSGHNSISITAVGSSSTGQSSAALVVLFHACTVVLCLLRSALFLYCFVEDDLRRAKDVRIARSLERIGSVTYFVGMSLVLFAWMEGFHKNYVHTTHFLPKLRYLFIATSVAMATCSAVLVFVSCMTIDTSQAPGRLSSSFEVFSMALLAAGVVVYGARLARKEQRASC
jgi:hypothetical protein